MRATRIIIGATIWLAISVGAGWLYGLAPERCKAVTGDLWRFVCGKREHVTLDVPQNCRLSHGDPIFAFDDHGQSTQVGEVVFTPITTADTERKVPSNNRTALFYPSSSAAMPRTGSPRLLRNTQFARLGSQDNAPHRKTR